MIVVHDANLKITRLVLDYADDYPAQLDARGERWLRLRRACRCRTFSS